MLSMQRENHALTGSLVDDSDAQEQISFPSAPPLTRFVGRNDELEELRAVFREGSRLVTMTGIGGIGKTRLAVKFVSGAAELDWANAYFVQLEALTNSTLVQEAVLEALGGSTYSSRSPLEAAADRLQGAPALVVLDCCEHVRGAARHVAEMLLHRCPLLAVLTTSRSPLGVAGEVVWAVPPLSMRRSGHGNWAEVSDAARLFVDRARRHYPQFELTEEVASTVETIARRVDGIPLAIELAASRVRVLSPEEIADGLGDHLGLLRSGQRTSDPRHQTMRASLDWSYELLPDHLRAFFARLSVFSGSFDLEAAATLCAGSPKGQLDILDDLESLIDSSLLVVERRRDVSRFRLLDFVRQYALELLAELGERELMAQRHRTYYLELAQRSDREIWALDPANRARLDDESSNLRVAIDDGCARAPEDALAIVGALSLYWRMRGRLREGVAAADQSLRCSLPEPSAERALSLGTLSMLSFWLGDFSGTMTSATAALETGAAVGDLRSQAFALTRLGALTILGDPRTGDPMLRKAADLARAAGDNVALCDSLSCLAISYHFHDDPDAMQIPLEEALKVSEAISFEDNVRWCLWCLSHTAISAAELETARAHGERALAMMPGDDPFCRYCAVEVLSILDAITGAVDAARERAKEELEPSKTDQIRLGTGVLMNALGVAALAAGDLDDARHWASSLYEQEPDVLYLAWHAQETLAAEALARDDSAQARTHLDVLETIAERLGNRRAWAIAHLGLARASLLDGDDQRAEWLAHDAINALVGRGWLIATIEALELVAEISIFQGRYDRGIRLIAAARSDRQIRGLIAFPAVRERIESQLTSASVSIGHERLLSALEAGTRLSLDEAVAYARRGRGDHAEATHGLASLSPSERQVVEHAAHGLSNPDIARELFMARDTVKSHLSHAYAKLGVANRTQLARFVLDRPEGHP
jgi:predicted ATPase/DNA-binding CsgD family transcriptional regulator